MVVENPYYRADILAASFMSGKPGQATLFGPAAIAIHDNGYMRGRIMRLDHEPASL
jgi:hypothetical protein